MTTEHPEEREVDQVIQEVRDVRERLWREGGGTSKGYFGLMERLTREREAAAKAVAPPARRKSA